jgi:Trypsin-like peptidase domain
VSSPPVSLCRVCANGPYRLRFFRARMKPVEFLVLAASTFLFLPVLPSDAQFPIRQMPGGPGVRGQESGVRGQDPRAGNQEPVAVSSPPMPAVARIVVPEKDGVSFGSGTLVDVRGQFGLVVSNWHVIRDASGQITVEFPDGFKSPAEVVKTDKDWDLAALSIYRPRARPMLVSGEAPQPGDALTIAGYGGGQWRVVSGSCTQYLAPGVEFPHEMVELSAEARQGDSGGPILNQRGELAGVLFGSGPGYTSGSYGGRVLKFLATVVPGGAPGGDGLPTNSLPTDRAVAALAPGQAAGADMAPPHATALHANGPISTPPPSAPYSPAVTPPQDVAALTPALKPTTDPLLSPPPRREAADRFGAPANGAGDAVDPRVAVAPSRLDLNSPPLASNGLPPLANPPSFNTSLPGPSIGAPTAGVDVNAAPPDQLVAVLWRHVGGPTLFDQTKTVLAIVGVLALLVVFVRFGSQKEREHEEE